MLWLRHLRNWLLADYDRRRRKIDIEILWPAILHRAPNIVLARDAFLLHCLTDPAWKSVELPEIYAVVESLS